MKSKRKRNRLRTIWYNMIFRCSNPHSKSYLRYGGRGIKVCDEWKKDFKAFEKWSLENGYSDDLSIDRINNYGDYEPSNCRWVNNIIQCNNRRSNKIVNYNNEYDSLANICRNNKLNYGLINGRIQRGIDSQRALSDNFQNKNKKMLTLNGITHSQSEWTKILGFSKNTISERLKNGWSVEQALTTPSLKKRKVRKDG